MFDGIASRYDFLNHFLSCFQDVLWRRHCCNRLKKMMRCKTAVPVHGIRLLDLCGGTGDFANTFRKIFEGRRSVAAAGATAVAAGSAVANAASAAVVKTAIIGDFSYGMLAEVKPKKINAHAVQLDAMKMPFADRQFDVILNGFGMRNVPDAKGALLESFRVLDDGGYLCVLEFFSPRNLFNKFFYKVLAPLFIPVMGAFFSGKREAYEYLVNSIIRFLPVDGFCKLAEECGFEVKHVKMFDGGISFGVFMQKSVKVAADATDVASGTATAASAVASSIAAASGSAVASSTAADVSQGDALR